MNRIRTGRPGARRERPWPGALSPYAREPDIVPAAGARAGRAFRKGGRDMMVWAGSRLWLAVRMVIRAVKMAHDEQVRMWECVLLTSGRRRYPQPVRCAGFRRWVVTGSSAATCRPRTGANRAGNPSWRPRAKISIRAPTADPPELFRAKPSLTQDAGLCLMPGRSC